MNALLKTAGALAAMACIGQAGAQVTFYEHDNYHGRSFRAERMVQDFAGYGFNDRASSIVIDGGNWEVCQDANFRGRCVVLRPGSYAALGPMDLNDRISSARAVGGEARGRGDGYDDGQRGYPGPDNRADYRRRRNERLFEANVTSVRAVFANPQQRCWMEREQVSQEQRGNANVPGAVIGAVLGGILGHQIGGGTGRDVATVGGVVAGAAVGANVNRDRNEPTTQNVQRCSETVGHGRPDYWDVTYVFRGQEHRMQTASPPGATVTVNRDGEPRI
jgi:uncharacterized protein YcfJ